MKTSCFGIYFEYNCDVLYRSMLYLLSLPAVIALVCQLVFASVPKNLNLAIVSDELIAGFQDCLSAPDYNCTHSSRPLSCRYMDFLETYDIKVVS